MKKILHTLILVASSLHIMAQPIRYLQDVFPTVQVSYDIPYAVNATILYLDILHEAVPEQLTFDFYQPSGDINDARPLIIFFHSGNFLPFPNNLGITGTKRDSSVVEMCKRLAKTGYVVASADYRLGWNPVAEPERNRVFGLINAAYRGVQDANTCIRFFKKSFSEDGNPFRIDTSRIILFGDDSGGYISLNAACLDRYDKIPNATGGKFLIAPNVPMIIESINGDVEGRKFGINTPAIPEFPYPPGDTLCYPNYPEYSSKFLAAVNLAGGVGDTAWIDPGQPPIISVHAPYDQTTPYKEDFVYVNVPPAPLRVVKVQGSYVVNELSQSIGNQNKLCGIWNVTPFQRAVTEEADSRNDGISELFPIYGDTISDGTPWVYWDCASIPPTNCYLGLQQNPHMSKAKANIYIDSIMNFVLPRLYCMILLSNKEIIKQDKVDINTYPNPTNDIVNISSNKDYLMRNISVFDLKGSLVVFYDRINESTFHLPLTSIPPGQYILKIQFDQGIAARQIIVN